MPLFIVTVSSTSGTVVFPTSVVAGVFHRNNLLINSHTLCNHDTSGVLVATVVAMEEISPSTCAVTVTEVSALIVISM